MAMPIVALPDWNGKDAEGHLNLLDATLQANGQLSILSEPLKYSALLFTSCKNERKATEFLQFHIRQHPESSTKAIRDAFLERFQSEGLTLGKGLSKQGLSAPCTSLCESLLYASISANI
jgi:hypothetical protein